MNDYRRGFGLEIGFTDHFNTRLVTTLNYSAIANLQTLQITTAHSKSLQSFTSRFPVTDFQLHQPSLFFTASHPTDTTATTCLGYNISAWNTLKTLFIVVLQAFTWERVCLCRSYPVKAVYICLLKIYCLLPNVVSLLISRSFYPVTVYTLQHLKIIVKDKTFKLITLRFITSG
jgi:hypothetical protein